VAALLPRCPLVLVLMLVLVIAPRSVLIVCARLVLVAVIVLHILWTVGDEVSWLSALKACPCGPPCVHSVLVLPLEPPSRQC
jgi:hypothetical protein